MHNSEKVSSSIQHWRQLFPVSDVNKARTLKAKAKATAVGNEAGTVPSRTAMGDHGK